MTKRKIIQLNRKWHRYLGGVLGIQFLFWTLGGLYFSWTNIDEIRGTHLKNKQPLLSTSNTFVSPSAFMKNLDKQDSISAIELVTILQKPTYRVVVQKGEHKSVLLFNAKNGKWQEPLNQKESIAVAREKLLVSAPVETVEYLDESGKHHEYRGRPLPAYAVTFGEPANTTAYVSAEYGNVQTFRSNEWRIFDFLWMLHTMDYEGRDNFNNILLRAFSIFGLFTIISGFSLYIFTSRIFNRKTSK